MYQYYVCECEGFTCFHVVAVQFLFSSMEFSSVLVLCCAILSAQSALSAREKKKISFRAKKSNFELWLLLLLAKPPKTSGCLGPPKRSNATDSSSSTQNWRQHSNLVFLCVQRQSPLECEKKHTHTHTEVS